MWYDVSKLPPPPKALNQNLLHKKLPRILVSLNISYLHCFERTQNGLASRWQPDFFLTYHLGKGSRRTFHGTLDISFSQGVDYITNFKSEKQGQSPLKIQNTDHNTKTTSREKEKEIQRVRDGFQRNATPFLTRKHCKFKTILLLLCRGLS